MEQEKNKMEQGKSKQQRMRELVELLNRARKAYEQDNTEIMSNYESVSYTHLTRFTFSNKRCKVSSERSLLMHLLRNTLLSADHLDKKFLAPQRSHSTMQI